MSQGLVLWLGWSLSVIFHIVHVLVCLVVDDTGLCLGVRMALTETVHCSAAFLSVRHHSNVLG